MTRPEQKSREVAFVSQLAQHVAEIRGRRPLTSESDPPDIRIAPDLGIEVTEFHRHTGPSPQVAIEKARERITRDARDAYESSRGAPVRVDVHYRDGPLPLTNAGLLSEQVSSAVLAKAAAPGAKIEIDGASLPEPAASHIFTIYMLRGHGNAWGCLSGGFVETEWSDVERLVRAKEADLWGWPAWAPRRWLLIVAPGTEFVDGEEVLIFSSMFPQLDRMPAPTLESRFERVYFLDVVTDRVRRLG